LLIQVAVVVTVVEIHKKVSQLTNKMRLSLREREREREREVDQ